MNKKQDLILLINEAEEVRRDFTNKALSDRRWSELGVDRVYFENVLLLFDAMQQELREITFEELQEPIAANVPGSGKRRVEFPLSVFGVILKLGRGKNPAK